MLENSDAPESFATTGGQSTYAAHGAHQQITRIELGDKFKATIFALSIILNVIVSMLVFWLMQEKRVDEEYHIQTQATIDKALARIELLEKSGPMTIIVKQEK